MDTPQDKITQGFNWLLPTGIEVLVYIFLTGVTLIMSGVDRLRDLLFVSGDFNPIRYAITGIDTALQHVVGEKVAASLSLAVFWGLVGVVVNILWWLGSNVTSEISSDLAFSRYVHPSGVGPMSQIIDFLKRAAVRTTAAVIGLLYMNYFISSGLPYVTNSYRTTIQSWSTSPDYLSIILSVGIQILLLHAFVVLTRIMFLRKRIFTR